MKRYIRTYSERTIGTAAASAVVTLLIFVLLLDIREPFIVVFDFLFGWAWLWWAFYMWEGY